MTLLVDGDICAYRCAAVSENEPQEIAILRLDQMMMDLLAKDEQHITFLTGPNNFRKTINPEYKANRKDKPRPIHLGACRDYLVQEYQAIITDGYEADDALGFHQTEDTIICSIDKDLLQIPGAHYNFIKKEYTEVSELDGLKSFYRSMLVGDVSDNVIGVKGIGKVKAAKAIDPLTSELEMFEQVQQYYENEIERFWMNANCLWLYRREGETFSKRYESLKEEG